MWLLRYSGASEHHHSGLCQKDSKPVWGDCAMMTLAQFHNLVKDLPQDYTVEIRPRGQTLLNVPADTLVVNIETKTVTIYGGAWL